MRRPTPTDSKEEQLYFLAIVPPAPIYDDALRQKLYFRDHYNSKASLNSPPHITLHMPFKWKVADEAGLKQHLQQFASTAAPVAVKLDNFSSFPPRVIFINVVMTQELDDLQKELHRFCRKVLNLFNANYKDLPFHPHLTIAFRDLKKPSYHRAWEEFQQKNFQAAFVADRVALLKHDGHMWKVHEEFIFQNAVA